MSKKPTPEPAPDRDRPEPDEPERPARPDDGNPAPTHPIAEPPPVVEPTTLN